MSTPPPLALQLYTVRDAADRDGMAEVLSRTAEMGYIGVESAGFGDLEPYEFAGACADLGLALASAHVWLGTPDEMASALDLHRDLGFERVVVPVLAPEEFASDAAVAEAAGRLSVACEMAAQRDLRLGYHNHYWELNPLEDGRPALLALFEMADPALFAEVDIYWAQVGGADPALLVAELGERAAVLHVKDGPADSPESPMVAAGQGAIDIPAVLAAASPDWLCVELDQCATDMASAVAASHDFLVGSGLARGSA